MHSAKTGCVIWLTGLSGAGKTTLGEYLLTALRGENKVEMLDGDVVRERLSSGLGFTREDRDVNVRRIGFVAELLARNGVIVIVAAISPYREAREEIKRRVGRFIEVFVDCPLDALVERDVKGLYKRALSGEIGNFTGISDPYEPPLNPCVVVRSDRESVTESAGRILVEVDRRRGLRMVVGM